MNVNTEKNEAVSQNRLILQEVDAYLMQRFALPESLVYLTEDGVISTHRNKQVDLYLRLRRVEGLFPADCLIIARISFSKERIGHGTDFVRFLTGTGFDILVSNRPTGKAVRLQRSSDLKR